MREGLGIDFDPEQVRSLFSFQSSSHDFDSNTFVRLRLPSPSSETDSLSPLLSLGFFWSGVCVCVWDQQLDLDSFARELDRLDRLCPPSSPKNVDDVDANSHEEVSSWIGSTGASGTEEEERRLVKQRVSASF